MDRAQQNGRLDVWLPVSHWTTRHDRQVAAPPADVARALREVTPGEMRLARPLVALRTLPSRLAGKGRGADRGPAGRGARHDAGGLHPAGRRAGERPDRRRHRARLRRAAVEARAVQGDPSRPHPRGVPGVDRPGYLKGVYAMWVEPDGAGSLLRTETRVFVTSESAARRFKPYWTLIEPFSGLIRRDWLAAGRRAERAA
jgi:hypothetical protein